MILWAFCKRNFEPDGALRDIYVHGTTIADWRSLFDVLHDQFSLRYSVDGEAFPFPMVVDEVFAIRETANPLLTFDIGGVVVACHFFVDSEIEFDISPREITSQAKLDDLLGFVQLVGKTLGKTVSLCYENDDQHPFITYEPSAQQFQYHEFMA
jgi:hypothetical protein